MELQKLLDKSNTKQKQDRSPMNPGKTQHTQSWNDKLEFSEEFYKSKEGELSGRKPPVAHMPKHSLDLGKRSEPIEDNYMVMNHSHR
jgi:hypothetical protein